MNLDRLEDGYAERDCLFRAADARCADTDRPAVRALVEVARRASRVCRRPLTAQLVQAPALAMAFVTEVFGEPTGVKMRTPRTVVVDHAIVGELRAVRFVERRQFADRDIFENRGKQRV